MRRFAAGLAVSLLLTGPPALSQQPAPQHDWPEAAIPGRGIDTKEFWQVMEDATPSQRANILYRMYQRIRGVPEYEIDEEITVQKARDMLIDALDQRLEQQIAERETPVRVASCYTRVDESLLGSKVLWGVFINRPDAGDAVITLEDGLPAAAYKPLPLFSNRRPYIIPIVTRPENIDQLTDISVKVGFNDGQPAQVFHGNVTAEESFFRIPIPSSMCQAITDSLRLTDFYNFGTASVRGNRLTVRFKNRLIFPRLLDSQGNQVHAVTRITGNRTVVFYLGTLGLSAGTHDIFAENMGSIVPVTVDMPQSGIDHYLPVRNKITAIVAAPRAKWLIPSCLTCALNRFVLRQNPYARNLADRDMLDVRLARLYPGVPVRRGGIVLYGPNYPKGLIFNNAASGSEVSWLLKMMQF